MKFLKFVLLALLFVGSSILVLTADAGPLKKIPTSKAVGTENTSHDLSPVPILAKNSTFPILSAQGVLVVDGDSSVVLYEKNADQKLLPASTTKIMTALVALNYYKLDDVVTIGSIQVEGQKMRFAEGEKITVENLLKGLLMYSANDAAEALARFYPKGRLAFIDKMNEMASDIHLLNTHFKNPTGLDEDGHFSTAKDMVHLSQVAMQNPFFADVVQTKEKTIYSVDKRFVYQLKNINELLGAVNGVKGIKTGWTEAARENLITYVERDDKKLYIALLGSADRFGETKELIEWVYSNYIWQDVYSPN